MKIQLFIKKRIWSVKMIFFSDRKSLAEEYEKWLKRNKGIVDSPFNVINFLQSKELLDEDKVKDYLKKID